MKYRARRTPTVMSIYRRRARYKALAALQRGGVIVFPTDTVYGIGGDALLPSVARKVKALKRRPLGKTFPWLVSDMKMAERYVRFSPLSRAYARSVWPGAVTLILPKKKGRGTLAVRIPAHARLRALVAAFGRPIIGTSANRSGRKPVRSVKEAMAVFSSADLFLDGGKGGRRPSTIVDCTKVIHRKVR